MASKIQNTGTNTPQANLSPSIYEVSPFFNYPSSTTSLLLHEMIGAGETLLSEDHAKSFTKMKQELSHGGHYDISTQKKGNEIVAVRYSKTTENAEFAVGFSDISDITKSNKAAQKILSLALIEVNKQALSERVLIRDVISFPLTKLLDIGAYTTEKGARKGFNTGAAAIRKIWVRASVQTKTKENRRELYLIIPLHRPRNSQRSM